MLYSVRQLNTYVKRKPVTEGLPIHSIHKCRYKREVLPDNTIQQFSVRPFDTTPPPWNSKQMYSDITHIQ